MYWLGIDIGSISTDLVVMDSSFDIVEKLYLRTRGKPLEAVKEGMEILGRSFEDKDIGGAGLTGSGRALGAALVGADVVKNEITAHARAAAFIDPEIHTVIEIGGQDSKLIVMKDGFVEDFAMNTVCAAGTGSFLDRQAERMGISVDEMGRMAAEAEKYVPIAGRCAVFAESDIIHKQQKGADEGELMAGMCHALASSFLSNLAKGRKIQSKICFQGGVASNKGMRKAFEDILVCDVMVPKEHKVMGALGAAILACEKSRGETAFRGFGMAGKKLEINEKDCGLCENNCSVVEISADGSFFGCCGDRCGMYSQRMVNGKERISCG